MHLKSKLLKEYYPPTQHWIGIMELQKQYHYTIESNISYNSLQNQHYQLNGGMLVKLIIQTWTGIQIVLADQPLIQQLFSVKTAEKKQTLYNQFIYI